MRKNRPKIKHEIALTEAQIEEFIKCYLDPIYYIENYTWIEVKEQSKIVPTKLFGYQKEILTWLVNGESGVVLKSRRVGASTVIILYISWLINFRRGVNALLLSRNEDSAKKLLRRVKFSYFNVKKHTSDDFALAEDASWLLNPTPVSSAQMFASGWYDDNGELISMSEVSSLTTTSESGRGDSATIVFMDELAFLPDQDSTMRSARLTALRGGQWLACSTPNGTGDSFHSLCMRAQRKENKNYNFRRVHWTEAEITEEMIEGATEGLSEASILQEMEMEFIASGDPVFNPTHLAACYKPIEEYPEVENELDNFRTLVNTSKGDHYYFSGVDSAVGKLSTKAAKRDYHSFTALTRSGIQAHAYHSNKDSLTEWAGNIEQLPSGNIRRYGIVSKLHKKYPGLMHIELNGPGQAVHMNHLLPEDGYSNMVGKQTTIKTKDQYIRQLIIAIESHAIIITDPFTYQCMSVYQRGTTPGTYSAPVGDYYDDPVISLALAWDALLSTGAIDFSWGAGTDKLYRKIEDTDVEYRSTQHFDSGPAVRTIEPTERLSKLMDNNEFLYDNEFDIDFRDIKEPEFIGK